MVQRLSAIYFNVYVLFHKLNKYYYALENKEVSHFYDMNGNEVRHRFGKPGYSLVELDPKRREKLCTLPEYRKRLFHDPELINRDSVHWGGAAGNHTEEYSGVWVERLCTAQTYY